MFNKIRITLVILILIFILPAYASAERRDEEGNEHQSSKTFSEFGDNSSCTQNPLTNYPENIGDDDFFSWEGSDEPVLKAGPGRSWDDSSVIGPEVLYTGAQYRMWYSGISGTTYQIGYATSKNGLIWEKSPRNPVLTVGEPGSWDDERVWAPAVIYNPPLWQMWYVGYSDAAGSQIGYATSEDGVNWEKYPGNPVFTPSIFDQWESNGVNAPYVIFENGIYHLWYSSHPDGSIGYAASADGIHWERYSDNPIIEPYVTNDELCPIYYLVSPTVVKLDEYHMWYQAGQSCKDSSTYFIVHSVSSDRVTWSEPDGAYGSFSWNAHYPTVISHHNGLLKQMWYVHCGRIWYAEENQLDLRKFLPLVLRSK